MKPVSQAPPGITFRPLSLDDLPTLHEWLSRPHVAEWWGVPGTVAEVVADYQPSLEPDATTRGFIAWAGGQPIGYIQSYVAAGSEDGWWPEVTDPGVRGIDQFLADAATLGQGVGTAMVRAFVIQLFLDPTVTLIQADPSPRNERAVRCYEKAGFRRVGVVDTPDGPAVLMTCERPSA